MTRKRKAQRASRPASQVVKPVNWPAPVKGWITAKPLEELPPDAAIVMQNFFPEPGYIRPRNGSNNWTTSAVGSIRTLAGYSGAVQKMFAFDDAGAIYDATSAGAPTNQAYPITSSDSKVSFTNFTNAGGHWLMCCTGLDAPFSYNSASGWASAALTGPASPSALFCVTTYRERLWFLETGTANLWFLPTDAVTGAMTGSVNLGDVMRYGGLPVAMGTWTAQTISGPVQFLCIISNEGELVVYTGSDPTNSANWSLLGTFKLGFPLGGINCMFQIGADLAIMTVDGIIPVSKAISLDPSASDQASLTASITPTWLDTVQTVGSAAVNWQFLVYPSRRMAIVNIPDPAAGTYQYVMNTETFAWTQFNAMPATSWLSWNGELFFGTDAGYVVQADTGSSDNGAAIDCFYSGAWNRTNDGMSPKQSTFIAVDAFLDSVTVVYAATSWNFNAVQPQQIGVLPGVPALAKWDAALWDVAVWPGVNAVRILAASPGAGFTWSPSVRMIVGGSSSFQAQSQILGGAVYIQQGSSGI